MAIICTSLTLLWKLIPGYCDLLWGEICVIACLCFKALLKHPISAAYFDEVSLPSRNCAMVRMEQASALLFGGWFLQGEGVNWEGGGVGVMVLRIE